MVYAPIPLQNSKKYLPKIKLNNLNALFDAAIRYYCTKIVLLTHMKV